MTLIEDTRQKIDQHDIKHTYFKQAEIEIIRCALPFGDYCIVPSISIDTKANMDEIASNIGSDHQRFKRECIAAKEAGCQLIILVENTEGITCVNEVHRWVNPEQIYRPRAITGERLQKAMLTMSERYGVRFEFCEPEQAAGRIIELLGVRNE